MSSRKIADRGSNALVMSQLGIHKNGLEQSKLLEYTGLSKTSVGIALGVLSNEGLVDADSSIHNGLQRRPPKVHKPTDRFWNNFNELSRNISSELLPTFSIIFQEAIESKRALPLNNQDRVVDVEVLRQEANYLGRCAVLGYYVNLSEFGNWWSGDEGWQAFIAINASLQS
jgi:hypothetical protein